LEKLATVHPETKDFLLELSVFSGQHSAEIIALVYTELKAER